MGKNKAETPNLATLMQEFMEQQRAKDEAFAAELREIRTGMAQVPAKAQAQASEPKASKKTRKAKKQAKRDLDVASYASQKHAPSSDKAIRKIKHPEVRKDYI